MKLVRETLYEGFQRNSADKLSSLGIGKIQLIKEWIEKQGIKNFHINDDYTIDVSGSLVLNGIFIPDYITFGYVKGNFTCENSGITSLKGIINAAWSFSCAGNKLTSLNGGPKNVRGFYDCSKNLLTSLEGIANNPTAVWCRDNSLTSLEYCPSGYLNILDCGDNKLTTLKGCPQNISGDIFMDDNMLTSFEFAPTHIGGNLHCASNNFPVSEIKRYKLTNAVAGKIFTKNQSK